MDKSFSNKMVFNYVNSWCVDFFWFKHNAAGRILVELKTWEFWLGNGR